ncbi:fungal-specific transcription factor domain-containing protein [Trichoderma barbatum]
MGHQNVIPSQAKQEHSRPKAQPRPHGFASPFMERIPSFGKQESRRFTRPGDGVINSYIKFNWPRLRTRDNRPSCRSVVTQTSDDTDNGRTREIIKPSTQSSSTLVATNRHLNHHLKQRSAQATSTVGLDYNGSPKGPRMLPSQFGLVSKMDGMDRRLWSFYISNWCPGRSILDKTNSWLRDFAPMHGNNGVLCAIQSLAGIYVYDYQPLEDISRHIEAKFVHAEARLSQLLGETELTVADTSELITISSILSMQDIVLTERRRKRPHIPRWLEALKQCEHFLESIDDGSRFWSKSNVQPSSLLVSQSIIVGRGVVISQFMTTLPSPSTFDPEKEAARFGWLLYGDMQDMYEIHGGCGFSKKLLHSMSQITYCAARLSQYPESSVVQLTAQFLLSELLDLRQWSSGPGSLPWEEVKIRPQTVEMVRATPEDFVIEHACHMAEVTAEAWRIAAIVYMQCRALRIPRNHPEVLTNLNDLAKCINIMPTSGYNFTAQAPLFPVFLLGMLATASGHIYAARTWFEKVTSTPVRSSVPPLYDALKRIWMWIDTESRLMPPVKEKLDEDVGKRFPWWEFLVNRVEENETEILCLT